MLTIPWVNGRELFPGGFTKPYAHYFQGVISFNPHIHSVKTYDLI